MYSEYPTRYDFDFTNKASTENNSSPPFSVGYKKIPTEDKPFIGPFDLGRALKSVWRNSESAFQMMVSFFSFRIEGDRGERCEKTERAIKKREMVKESFIDMCIKDTVFIPEHDL
jgi:hypothetical protein